MHKGKIIIIILAVMNYCFQSLALCPKLWYNTFWLTSRRWPNVHIILVFPLSAMILKDKKLQFVHPGTLLISSPDNCNFNRLLNQIWRFLFKHGTRFRVFSYRFSRLFSKICCKISLFSLKVFFSLFKIDNKYINYSFMIYIQQTKLLTIISRILIIILLASRYISSFLWQVMREY